MSWLTTFYCSSFVKTGRTCTQRIVNYVGLIFYSTGDFLCRRVCHIRILSWYTDSQLLWHSPKGRYCVLYPNPRKVIFQIKTKERHKGERVKESKVCKLKSTEVGLFLFSLFVNRIPFTCFLTILHKNRETPWSQENSTLGTYERKGSRLLLLSVVTS